MIYKTQAHAARDLAYWQQRLRLQDWDITLLFGQRQRDLDSQKATAEVTRQWPKKIAFIALLKASEILTPEDGAMHPVDQERDLVHELLHVAMSGFDTNSDANPQHDFCEQFVHQLSVALVTLRRRKK